MTTVNPGFEPTPLPLPSPSGCDRRRLGWIALCLLGLVAAVHGRTLTHGFLSYDDDRYVYANAMVIGGLTNQGVQDAFLTTHHGAWHPLTTVSHQLAWTLFGPDPAGHHGFNILLHGINSVLVLLLVARLTQHSGWSGAVALLFALHPLHVESVAWVTERKDVLSGFFALASLLAYLRYAARPGVARYLAVATLLALGLLSKSMLVTLPFVYLLLDYWPLGRTPWWQPGCATAPIEAPSATRSPAHLLFEKLPLLTLAAGASIVTARAHTLAAGGGVNATTIPLAWRIINAPLSYVAYLAKAAWPTGLASHYPHPALISPERFTEHALLAAAATALLVALIGIAAATRRHRPWLLVGWLWYLGMMVPVIGLVQVGYAARADRFVYLPFIGLYLAAAGLGIEALGRWPGLDRMARVAAGGGLLLLVVLSWRQAAVWRDDIALFEHAIAVTERNATAHHSLGIAYGRANQLDRAERELRTAIAITPDRSDFHSNLGYALARQGRLEFAIDAYQRALALSPDDFDTHYLLGSALGLSGDYEGAARHYGRAVELDPEHADARRLLEQARTAERLSPRNRAPSSGRRSRE